MQYETDMSTASTYTTSPSFDDYTTGKNRLVLNVEMSFLRDQLASQTQQSRTSTFSRTNQTHSRLYSDEPSPKFQRTIAYRPEVRRSHPLDIYFKSESGRRRFALEKKYSPWTYYNMNGDDYPEGDILPAINPPSRALVPEMYEDKGDKRVAFAFENDRLPNITPVSRNVSPDNKAMQNACDVLFISKTPKTDKRVAKGKSTPRKVTNDEDETDIYNISFTPNNQGFYDPSSELHSDYYTLKRVDSKVNIMSRPLRRLESKQTQNRHRFNAILIGTRKYLHRRNQIECDGYMSVPIEKWSQPKVFANRSGYDSVPLRNYDFSI